MAADARPAPPGRVHGFTLLELLIVMLMVGVVAAALLYNQNRNRQRQVLREGVYQVISELIRARSQAQVTSRSSTVSVVVADPANRTFRVATGGNAAVTRPLPANLTLRACAPLAVAGSASICGPSTASSSVTVEFQPPYGTLDAAGNVWQVTSTALGESLYVKVVGVTGKVILSDNYAH